MHLFALTYIIIFMEENRKKSAVLNIALILFIMICSAIGGWIYEVIFYRIADGRWINRGTSLGPWIPVYGFGGLLILFSTWRFRKNPVLVFFIGGAVSTILEFFTGLVLFECLNLRLWDYNVEPWNFLNIGGYICFRSWAIFSAFSLLLIYVVVPSVIKVERSLPRKVFITISFALAVLYVTDVVFHAATGLL